MQVWPAIDLRNGKVVRLSQGDYARETVYGEDPVVVAQQFANEGAQYLHLVDLDGARAGRPGNLPQLTAVLRAFPGQCEVGGGIRNDATIERLLELGAARVVVGTAALRDPDWFRAACRRWPGQLVLGVDARDGHVATDGWTQTSQTEASVLAAQFADESLAAIVYTDIATDDMLSGPNVEAMAQMQRTVDIPVVASGGISGAADVAHLAAAGLAGCIIGRALYEGTLTVTAALGAAQ